MSIKEKTMGEQKIEHTQGELVQESLAVYATLDRRKTMVAHTGVASDAWVPTEMRLANARRVVACWNACVGIGTETLERVSEGKLNIRLGVHMFADLEAQNKELREALKTIVDCYGAGYTDNNKFVKDVHEFMMEARAVLTKAGV